MISLKDIKILTLIHVKDKVNPYKAASVSDIIDLYDEIGSSISMPTVRRSISKLINENYIEEGYKKGKTKTYYVSEKGIKLLSELK